MRKLRAMLLVLIIVFSAGTYSLFSTNDSLGASASTCPGVGCVGGFTPCAFLPDGTLCLTTPP